jgi:formylglycine-generating enzyme required for sulfatase activity
MVVRRFFGLLYLAMLFACTAKKSNQYAPVPCYTPNQTGLSHLDTTLQRIKQRPDTNRQQMVYVQAGLYTMGATYKEGYPEEYPAHEVEVSGFWMDMTEVTNDMFAAFVKATNYITTAERKVDWDLLKQQLPVDWYLPPPKRRYR